MPLKQVSFDTVEDAQTVANEGQDVTFHIHGTWGGVISFEGSINGSSWELVLAQNLVDEAVPTASSTTTDGIFKVIGKGLVKIRARFSTDTSGTALIDTEIG